MRLSTAALVLMLAAGCSPAVQSAVLVPDPPEPRPPLAPVRIYAEARPDCALREIGTVRAYARGPGQSAEEVVNAMRERARRMGGDAIVGFATDEVVDGGVAVPVGDGAAVISSSSKTVYKGTVVRFDSRECSEEGQSV